MGIITTGIASIQFGAMASDGGMGEDLDRLGYTVEGTAKINTDDGTTTDYMVEETDDPLDSDITAGKMTVTLTIADPDEDTFVNVFGGTKTGTGADTVYEYPESIPSIEQSIKITPKKGIGFDFVRAKITGKFTSDLGRGKLMGVEITATILQPLKAGVKKFKSFRV